MQTIDWKKGLACHGDTGRIRRVMQRAQQGENLTIGFLGGSITQGCLASQPSLCYAARVTDWWKKTFPEAQFRYVNAGIGGTTSHFGVARAGEDLLQEHPDFVILEFSVNDDSTPFFCETYEGAVRTILQAPGHPALMLVHNVRYDTGGNAQVEHARIGRWYQLPSVSMQSSIYPEVAAGRIQNREITPDDLHPNDAGHALVAGVITGFLEEIRREAEKEAADAGWSQKAALKKPETEEQKTQQSETEQLPKPMTANAYEGTRRYRNTAPGIETEGFTADLRPQNAITEIFRKGWQAREKGAVLRFTVTASEIAVQYRKTIRRPAPVAIAVLDADTAHAQKLDAGFEEDWGDCLYLQPLLVHGAYREHQIEIRLTETAGEEEFYLVSFLCA